MDFDLDDLRTGNPIRPGMPFGRQAVIASISMIALLAAFAFVGVSTLKWAVDPLRIREKMIEAILEIPEFTDYRDRSASGASVFDVRARPGTTLEELHADGVTEHADEWTPRTASSSAVCIYSIDGTLLWGTTDLVWLDNNGKQRCPLVAETEPPWLTREEFASTVTR